MEICALGRGTELKLCTTDVSVTVAQGFSAVVSSDQVCTEACCVDTGLATRSFKHAIEKCLPSDAPGRETEWSRDRLVSLLKERLSGIRVIVVANREPYIHNRLGGPGSDIRWIRPASGLVTALDPIMRATGGVWIAHAAARRSRDADERGRPRRTAAQAVVQR